MTAHRIRPRGRDHPEGVTRARGALIKNRPGPSRSSRGVAVGCIVAMLTSGMDQTLVLPALPHISTKLGAAGSMSWIVTGYLGAIAVSLPVWGKLADRSSKVTVLRAASAVFLVGAAMSVAAPSFVALVGARTVQGIGAGGLAALAETILGVIVSPRDRGRWLGLAGVLFLGITTAGPVLGGLVVDEFSWRAVFLPPVVLAAVSVTLVRGVDLSPTEPPARRLDHTGILLLALSISATMVLLDQAADEIMSIRTLACAAVVGFGVTAIRRRERGPWDPITSLAVVTAHRATRLALFASVSVSTLRIAPLVLLPLHLQVLRGGSVGDAGSGLVPMLVGIGIGGLTGGSLSTYLGQCRGILVAGSLLATTSSAALCVAIANGASSLTTSMTLLLLGVGLGLVMPQLTVVAQNDVPRRSLGAVTSSIQLSRQLGAAIGVALVGGVLSAQLRAVESTVPGGIGTVIDDPASFDALSGAARTVVADAVTRATVYGLMLIVPFAAVATALCWAMPKITLRRRVRDEGPLAVDTA